MSFVNLHVHSAQGSLLDSILTVKQIAQYAKENGQPAIALSDHGYMYGSLNLSQHVKFMNVMTIFLKMILKITYNQDIICF